MGCSYKTDVHSVHAHLFTGLTVTKYIFQSCFLAFFLKETVSREIEIPSEKEVLGQISLEFERPAVG